MPLPACAVSELEDMSELPPPDRPLANARPRWFLPLIGASIIALVAANNIGNIVWASWLESRPLGLLALNSSNKYLLGTSVSTELVPFMVIAVVRLMLPDPLFWLLGYAYRDRALHWGRQVFPAMNPLFDQFEEDRPGFRRLLDALVVIMPNNPVSLLAGMAAMPIRRFLLLSFLGTVGRVAIMRTLGEIFRDQIEDLLDVVAQYQGWLMRGSLILVVGFVAWQAFSQKGLVGGVESLDDEFGDD